MKHFYKWLNQIFCRHIEFEFGYGNKFCCLCDKYMYTHFDHGENLKNRRRESKMWWEK